MYKWGNIPALKFAVLLVLGILIGSQIYFNGYLIITIIISLLILIFIFSKKENTKILFSILSFLVIMFCGIFKSNIDFYGTDEHSIKYIGNKYITNEVSHEITISGIVKDYPEKDTSKIKFIFECSKILGTDTTEINGMIVVTIKKNRYNPGKDTVLEIDQGDYLELRGNLAEPLESRNPGEFNYKKYLYLNNIYKTFFVNGYDNVNKNNQIESESFFNKFVAGLKKYSIENINKLNKGDGGAFLLGLVVGERDKITKEMKDYFLNAGIMHLVAVSGLNIAYVILSIMLVLSLFRVPQIIKILISIICVIIYCVFTGSSASVLRASVMGICALLYGLVERKKEFYNIVGISLLFILIYNTKQLFDSGFILSYSAVLSMVFVYERFDVHFIRKISEKDFRGKKFFIVLIVLISTSLAAQIGTLPISASYFEKISIISIITNLFEIPLSDISLALGFLQIIFSTFSNLLASIVAETNNLLLDIQLFFIKFCADIKFASLKLYRFDIIYISGYYIILVLIITIKRKSHIIFRVVLSIFVVIIIIIIKTDFQKKLTVTFLDVGQGDCTFIETPNGKNILLDCGPISANFNSAEKNIVPFLERKGIDKIDLMILTHLHKDHIGGFSYLIDNFKISRIMESGQATKNEVREVIDSTIIANKINRDIVGSGDIVEIFGEMKLYILFPNKEYTQLQNLSADDKQLNFTSLAFKLKYRNTDILFLGDIEKEQEEKLINTYDDFLKADLIKISHHGSNTSSVIPLLLKVKPSYSVIFCGLFNMYKNPSFLVLNRLKNLNSTVFRTDLDGALIFQSNGEKIEPVEWH